MAGHWLLKAVTMAMAISACFKQLFIDTISHL
jgi:hypothetical protein